MTQKKQIEFGDFQTPLELASEISRFIRQCFPNPEIIIEPTCGSGNFLKACLSVWEKTCLYYGFDINKNYILNLKQSLKFKENCFLQVEDFFTTDWKGFFRDKKDNKILVIGNPPWVTNAALGSLKSNNLPTKSNFQGLRGFAAKTGKANFDIAEWMLIKLIESLQGTKSCLSMLCKTATARKVLKHAWINDWHVHDISLHLIDAKRYFGVNVDACLLIIHITPGFNNTDAFIYKDFSFSNKIGHFGMIGSELISNIDDYKKYNIIEGYSYYKWRSGIKHDAVKVMELIKKGNFYVNSFGETVEIEDEYIYPLLKSSDISNNRLTPRKYVIVTQHNVGDDTSIIKNMAPKIWEYLEKHSDILDKRKSIIYQKRPQFSVFGIGNYSFTPWKVAISGLYKTISFSVVGNICKKPIMVDDTCYFIPCESEEEANLLTRLLNSDICIKYLSSLVFFDSKRPINIDVLKRIDLKKLAEMKGEAGKIKKYLTYAQTSYTHQIQFVFDKEEKYRMNRSS